MNTTHDKRQFKESPEQHANFLSKFSFWSHKMKFIFFNNKTTQCPTKYCYRWMKDIYKLGTKGILKPKDIYQLKSELGSKEITEKFIKLWADEMKRQNPSMFRLLFRKFGGSVLFWGICYSVLDVAMR